MARLGRGQPFKALVQPARQADGSPVVAGPAAPNVTVTAYFGAVSVTLPTLTPPGITVAPEFGAANVSTTESPPNITVAPLFGGAVSGTTYNQPSVPNVTVAAYYGSVSVSAPGPNLIYDTSYEGGISGWGKYDSNSSGADTTIVQSSAEAYSGNHSLLLTTNGSAVAPETNIGQPVPPSVPITISAWVYSPQGYNGAYTGMDWYPSSGGSYISSSAGTTVSIAANTWTFVTCTAVSPATANWVHAKVGWTGTPGSSIQLYVDSFSVANAAYVEVAANLGTPATNVNGLLPNVSVAAYYGEAQAIEPEPIPTPNIAVAAVLGTPGTAVALTGAVTVTPYFGAVSVTLPQPSTPNIPVTADYGNAYAVANTNFTGSTGAVAVAGHLGGPGAGPSLAPPGITVQAHFGSIGTSIGFTARVTVAAPSHGAGGGASFAPVQVTAAAPVGAPGTSVTTPTAAVEVAAHTGAWNITLPMPGGRVNVTAPTGGAGAGASLAPANVEVTSPAGVPSVSVGLTGAVEVSSHLGTPVSNVNGQTAGIIVLAPVSPLVAGLYPKSSQAIISFYAGAVKQRRIWFGYGMTNTMNTNVPNPGET